MKLNIFLTLYAMWENQKSAEKSAQHCYFALKLTFLSSPPQFSKTSNFLPVCLQEWHALFFHLCINISNYCSLYQLTINLYVTRPLIQKKKYKMHMQQMQRL